MLEELLDLDKALFLFLNEFHSPVFDFIMYWSSNKLIWIPLYLVFIYLLFRFYRKQAIYIIIGAVIVVGLSDLISVHLFKNVFLRLRPCHEPSIADLVHLVNNHCGGEYGFYSSHASNHFALGIWMSFFLYKKIRFIVPGLMIWALLISYSRIYLGVHYPLDVITGIIMGTSISILGYYSYKNLQRLSFFHVKG